MSLKIDAKEKVELLDAVEKLRSFIENLEVERSCASCTHFIDNAGICQLYRQSPPAHIIPVGCPGWELFPTPPF